MNRCLSFILLVMWPIMGYAQSTPTLTTTSEEVVVTGSRYARTLAESPQRVSIIDSATVAQAADLSQLLSEQAGIVINGAYSNPGKDKSIFLRNGANQFTLILVDGQPLLDPSSLGGAVDLRLLSLAGIERIEILRGARSLLYGSDAVAGVINLITKKNHPPGAATETDPFTLHLRAAAQSYNTLETGVTLSGTTKKLDYRLGFDYFNTEGLSEATEPAATATAFGKDGATRQTLHTTLTYRPTSKLSIRPALRIANFTGDYDAGSFQDGDNTYTNELVSPSLAVAYTSRKSSIGLRANYAKTDRIFTDATFGTSEFLGRAHQEDLFATIRPTDRAAITFGSQLRNERLDRAGADLEDQSATTISPYLQLNLIVAEDLLVEAGYRYNNHSNFGGQGNWSLALGVNSTESWSTRLSLGSAFQSPTLDQLGGPFGANADLQPQRSLSVELSTQLADPEGSYQVSLTGFQRQIDNLIVYTLSTDFPFGRYENRADEQLDRGIELEGFLRASKRFRINTSLSYVKGTLTQTDAAGGTTETEDFFRRPRTTGSVGITFSARAPFLARLSAHYTGERPDVWFDANFARTEVVLDPFLLVNAYAEYRFLRNEQLKVFLDLRNLTDTNFVEVTGFTTQGLTVRGGLAVLL